MSGTVVVLVNGEVLANGQGSTIFDQRLNARKLAEGLLPLFESDTRVVILHGNKPQVGFVLFRSELASHALHSIPLDVCGADTQGATGFMLSQAFTNVLRRANLPRKVMCVVTQTRVEGSSKNKPQLMAIGPWFDREKAETYRQTRGWNMIEEPGRGYRRAVPSLTPVEILEFEGISQLVDMGVVVIAGGGGGVPVMENAGGDYEGIEAVTDTEQVAVLMAQGLKAKVLLSVIENDNKFILSGLSTEFKNRISLETLDEILARETFSSRTVDNKLKAASEFLHKGGEQVVITTLRNLPETLTTDNGLRIGSLNPTIELFRVTTGIE
jgi:carbamate kinase